jgi:hypothetical protein
MKTYPPTVPGFHDALWDHVPHLDMSDVHEWPEEFRVDVGLKFRWWVYYVPFLQRHLIGKAVSVLDRIRPANIEVNVISAPYGLSGRGTRKRKHGIPQPLA